MTHDPYEAPEVRPPMAEEQMERMLRIDRAGVGDLALMLATLWHSRDTATDADIERAVLAIKSTLRILEKEV